MSSNKVVYQGQLFTYDSDDGWFGIEFPTDPQIVKTDGADITEKPCKNCQRVNDINVLKCWWCSYDNPTEHK